VESPRANGRQKRCRTCGVRHNREMIDAWRKSKRDQRRKLMGFGEVVSCAFCKSPMVKKKTKTIYCSYACRNEARRERFGWNKPSCRQCSTCTTKIGKANRSGLCQKCWQSELYFKQKKTCLKCGRPVAKVSRQCVPCARKEDGKRRAKPLKLCVDCGVKISRQSHRCLKCAAFHNARSMPLSHMKCVQCGAGFEGTSKHKYCSQFCAYRSQYARHFGKNREVNRLKAKVWREKHPYATPADVQMLLVQKYLSEGASDVAHG
jgi:hypothetical protein